MLQSILGINFAFSIQLKNIWHPFKTGNQQQQEKKQTKCCDFHCRVMAFVEVRGIKALQVSHKTLCFLYDHYYISNSDLGKKGCQTL